MTAFFGGDKMKKQYQEEITMAEEKKEKRSFTKEELQEVLEGVRNLDDEELRDLFSGASSGQVNSWA